MKNRLKELREAAGLNQRELGDLCEPPIPNIYISRYETGKVNMPTAVVMTIAKALKVSPSQILGFTPDSVYESRVQQPQVPVVGQVGAGAEVFPVDDHAKGDGLEMVDCPINMNPRKTIALQVVGESMEPLISQGFLLFYDERHYGVPADYLGKICVVKIVEGPTLVKRIKRGSATGRYRLICINPAENEIEAEIEWSAIVKTMVQR